MTACRSLLLCLVLLRNVEGGLALSTCPPEVTAHGRQGDYSWPETGTGRRAALPCVFNPDNEAQRFCVFNITVKWAEPDVTACVEGFVTSPDFSMLENITITTENVDKVTELLLNLTSPPGPSSSQEVELVLGAVQGAVALETLPPPPPPRPPARAQPAAGALATAAAPIVVTVENSSSLTSSPRHHHVITVVITT
ncbi:adhesion G-protein coupled receptor G4-like, partial [Lampetra planeri]